MPYWSVYIGELEDPRFDWECKRPGAWSGNCPKRISPLLPGGFSAIIEAIDSGEIDGKQVDWAGWVARMLPGEIAAFFEKHVGSSWSESDEDLPDHMRENQIEFKRFVEELDPNRRYALVASEL